MGWYDILNMDPKELKASLALGWAKYEQSGSFIDADELED